MKNIIMCMSIIVILFSSCEKKYDLHRGYSYPVDNNDPTGLQHYGNVMIEEYMHENGIIGKIRRTKGLENQEIIFLNSEMYIVKNGYNEYIEITDPRPEYMIFPYMIEYNTDSWDYNYILEYLEIGEEEFCLKYFNGEKTLGMMLNENN